MQLCSPSVQLFHPLTPLCVKCLSFSGPALLLIQGPSMLLSVSYKLALAIYLHASSHVQKCELDHKEG